MTTGPRTLECSGMVCCTLLPAHPILPAGCLPSAQGARLPLASSRRKCFGGQDAGLNQGEERDLMPFGSEIAACLCSR